MPDTEDLKQKGWTLNTEEVKRRKKLNADQESANVDHENVNQYDSNDANIDPTRVNVPQQQVLPGLELTPEEEQAQAQLNIARGIGGQDAQRDVRTRSTEQGELGIGVETPVLPRTERDAKNTTESVGTTVVTSESDTTGTTGREGRVDSTLKKQKGRKKLQVPSDSEEEINLPPINNNLSVEEEQSFKDIQRERGLTDQQLADLKETYIADRNVKLRQQARQKFEEEQAKARRAAAARQRALDRENQQEGEEIVDIDEDVNLDIPVEQQLTIPGLEPTSAEREELIRRIGAEQERGGRGQVTGRPDVRDDRQQELPEIETIEEFQEQQKRIEDKANQENRPLPAQIIEFFTTFQNIARSEGIDAARQYRRNRLADPNFKALLDREEQAQVAIDTAVQEQTQKPEDFRSDNRQDAVNYVKENNLGNDYFIKQQKEFASIVDDKGEQVVIERPTDFTLEKRKTLKSTENRKNIVNEIASYMADYESKTPGTVFAFNRIIRDNKGTEEQQKNLIDKFLKSTLNKQQYKTIADSEIYRTNITKKGDTSILNGVINAYVDKTILETTGYKQQEIAISKERIENFDTYDVAILLKQQAYELGVDIPAFIKTGASFGSKRAPIETATDIDSLMEAVLGDYIYEQSFDTVLSTPKDPITGKKYDIASFVKKGTGKKPKGSGNRS